MGKFEKLLESEMAVEWREKYIDYKRLKDLLHALTPNVQHGEQLNAVRALAQLRHQDQNAHQPNRWGAFQKHSPVNPDSSHPPVLMRSLTPPRETFRSQRLIQMQERQQTAPSGVSVSGGAIKEPAAPALPELSPMYYDPALGIRKIPESVHPVLNSVSGVSNDDSALSSLMSTEVQREKWRRDHEIVNQQTNVRATPRNVVESVDKVESISGGSNSLNPPEVSQTTTTSKSTNVLQSTSLLPPQLSSWLKQQHGNDEVSSTGSDHILDSIDGPEFDDDEENPTRPAQLQPVIPRNLFAKPLSILLNSSDDDDDDDDNESGDDKKDAIVDNSRVYAQNLLMHRLQHKGSNAMQSQLHSSFSVPQQSNVLHVKHGQVHVSNSISSGLQQSSGRFGSSNTLSGSSNYLSKLLEAPLSSGKSVSPATSRGDSPGQPAVRKNQIQLSNLLENSSPSHSPPNSTHISSTMKATMSSLRLDDQQSSNDDQYGAPIESTAALSGTGSSVHVPALSSSGGLTVATKRELTVSNLDAGKVEQLMGSLMSDTSGTRVRRESIAMGLNELSQQNVSLGFNSPAHFIENNAGNALPALDVSRRGRLGSVALPIPIPQKFRLPQMDDEEDVDSAEKDDLVNITETEKETLAHKLESLSRKAAGLPALGVNPVSVSRSLRGAKRGVSERVVDVSSDEVLSPDGNDDNKSIDGALTIDMRDDNQSVISSTGSNNSMMSMHSMHQISSFLSNRNREKSRTNLQSTTNATSSAAAPASGTMSKVPSHTNLNSTTNAGKSTFFQSPQKVRQTSAKDSNISIEDVSKLFEDDDEQDNVTTKRSIVNSAAGSFTSSHRSRSVAMPSGLPRFVKRQSVEETKEDEIDYYDPDLRDVQVSFPENTRLLNEKDQEQVHEQYRDLSVYTVGLCQKGLYSSKRISSLYSRPVISNSTLESEQPIVRPREEIESELTMLPVMDSLVPACEKRTLECVFFAAVQAQLDKVNDFCMTLEEYYSYHLQACIEKVKQMEQQRMVSEHGVLMPLLNMAKNSNLKASLQELYRGLHLLESYQRLNLMGFIKIMQKHDEQSPWFDQSQEICLPIVFSTHFAQSNAGEQMLAQVEEMYLRVFGKAKKDAMQHMMDSNFQMTPLLSLFVGFFIGIMLSIIVAIITLFVNYPTKSFGSQAFIDVFPIFSCLFQLCFHLWQYSIMATACVSLRVNYVLCLQLAHHSFIRPLTGFLISAVFTCLLLISFTIFCFSNTANADTNLQHYSVLCVFILFICAFICPFNILARPTRFYMQKKLLRLIGSPFTQATIQETFFGDHITSLVRMIQDLSYTFCYYLRDGDLVHDSSERARACNSSIHSIVWVIGMLPHFFRLMQCLRQFAKSRKPFPFLYNALKYLISCSIAFFSWLRSNNTDNDHILRVWICLAVVGTVYSSWWDIFVDWQQINRHKIAREHYYKLQQELKGNHTDTVYGIVTNGEEDEEVDRDSQVLVRKTVKNEKNEAEEHVYSEHASGDEVSKHSLSHSFATLEDEDVLMQSSACARCCGKCLGSIGYRIGLTKTKRAMFTCMLPPDLLASFFTFNEHISVYYLFAVLNTFLRVGWLTSVAPDLLFGQRREYLLTVMGLLEQIRRAMWSFLRLEAEHTKNMQAMHASNLEDVVAPKPAVVENNNYANDAYGFPAGYVGVASMYETNNVMEGDGGFYVDEVAVDADEIQDDIAHISTSVRSRASVEMTDVA